MKLSWPGTQTRSNNRGGASPRTGRRAASFVVAAAVVASGLTSVAAMTVLPATSAQAADGPAWTCSTYGYLFQTPNDTTHQIIQVDLVSGESTQIGTTADNVNAVGYNPTDNYIYGSDIGTGNFVQVASDGTLTQLPNPAGLVWSNFNVGDFDADGHYWVTNSGDGARWYEIDYAAGSDTYGQVLSSGTNTGTAFGADWVYVNGGLYSVNAAGHIIKFDTTTHRTTDLGVTNGTRLPAVQGGGYGAGYADASGNLYFSLNNTGEIYRVDPTTLTAIDLSSGPASGGNDGVRCASAPIPTVTVTKTVDGRAATDDQFTVGLDSAAGRTLDEATTTGTETTASTTDWPVSQGTTYTITDAMAAGSTAPLAAYGASVVCTDSAGNTLTTGGTKGAWTFTVPGQDAYNCNVTNAAPTFTVTKTASTAAVDPGSTVDYTVTVKNTSTSDFTDANPATFTDDLSNVLDDATYNDDATATAGTASYGAPTLAWSGPLAAGATATVKYSATVNDPDTGDKHLKNAVVPGRGGSCDPADSCTTDTGSRSYTVKKTASTAKVAAGGTVDYTVTVTNTGEGAYTAEEPASFKDDLSKVLDDATYNDDVTAGGTVDGDILTWKGAVPVGESVTVTYSVTVNNPDTGDRKLTNAVVPTLPGGGCATEDGCTTNTLVSDPSYTVSKSASSTSANPGSSVTYTVTVKNTGAEDYTADNPASFKDNLSDVLDDATYNGDASNGATVKGNTLSWSGALKAGATVKVTYSVTVNDPNTGDLKLRNVVLPGNGTGTCDPDASCVTNTKVDVSPIVIAPAAGPSVATGGTALTPAPMWPWIGSGALALAGMVTLGLMTLRRRQDTTAGD
jgi:fimbrial isopeptide formation D2 family protein/uncharacterized repeat protein (TIGR01451 family)